MQYPVPQFLDVEDKIIGPFSLIQFGFIFGGGLIDVAIYRIFGVGIILFLIGLPIALASIAMAFVIFNGKHLYYMIPVVLKFVNSPKVMVFHREARDEQSIQISKAVKNAPVGPVDNEPAQSKLKRIAKLLDQKNQEENEYLNR
jgi:hypothetical protein